MKGRFRSFYPHSDDELKRLWGEALVVLDTNILLALYGRTPATRKIFIDALDAVADRLWMPHQVGLEFHQKREKVRRDATQEHNQVTGILTSAIGKAQKQVRQIAQRDHLLKSDQAFDRLNRATKALKVALDASKKRLTAEREDGDPVLDLVERLYPDERVGEPFSSEELSTHRHLASERFHAEQPPGFADAASKSGDRAFGDYFLWVQVMQHAGAAGKDVILVSEDRAKGDWIGDDGQPLPALRSEFSERTGQEVLILDNKTFLEQVSERITKADSEEVERAAEEIEEAVAASRQRMVIDFKPWTLSTEEFENLGAQKALAELGKNLISPGLTASLNNWLVHSWRDVIPRNTWPQLLPEDALRALVEASRQAAEEQRRFSEDDTDTEDDAEDQEPPTT